MPDRDLGAQHAAPRLAQQVVFVDAERAAHRVELVDEQLGCPEVGRGIGQVGAGPAADLVVVDHLATGFLGQFGDVTDVVVGHSRAAMQDEQGESAAAHSSGLVICTQVSWPRKGTRQVSRGMAIRMDP